VTGPHPLHLPVSRLVLWRHGRTEWNVSGRFQGQLDPPLDHAGREQAARVAPHLAAVLRAEQIVVVSSDLSRATETAAPLAELLGVPLRTDPRLREHGLGSWEGLTRAEVAERFPEQYADWQAGRPVRGRGGEDPASVARRALDALRELPSAEIAVVVTHGGTAGRLVESLLQLGEQHRRVFGPLANCAWSELAFQSSRWRLMRHNTSVLQVADGHRAAAPAPAGPGDAAASPEGGAETPGDADAVQ
jgi:probable phosphoglycerate mutase